MSAIPIPVHQVDQPAEWTQPYKGRVGMYCLIAAESAIFAIFVVAYVFYLGKSMYGPTPGQVLEVPIFNTICLLSSSITIWLAEHALEHNRIKRFGAFWAVTIVLGSIFMIGTGMEWNKLIYHDGLTITTNVFGTTYYSLVGLHASHVIVGLLMLLAVLVFTLMGHMKEEHAERVKTLALYWHFVDAIWVVVFTVVYVIGR
ncbi:cytochrome c oxidase subunit 3 [Acidipila rosea]|uniref:Cytochrome c oxidase subunit 3/cytochrome o ubiquinol oxidase subunit 3 n=1 Tax=Acidipila rosea TaxID=768535 RepID=A0A4R1LBE4_9BACT|nr:heme-copper oxidase subunit III [Acidipila rosea]MBW4027261.1 heme-copper oxidase subunit III [Acidobacteriota bacterium]MBW4046151.1 heme-copper oxidase subunit III [Acidobacteriota bacterium]TCK74233.1 cytochrome c oxidase subunit 3/cytochrome o ubiquinol oxidase subunit 3 [Acidipila rosea]